MKNKLKNLAKLFNGTKNQSLLKKNKTLPQEPNSQNSHIEEFLKYYFSLEHSPYFAVLISGAWGIGKTHLIKSILTKLLDDTSHSYVSLYGVGSIDDIDAALYQSFHPVLASTGAKIIGRIGKLAMKYGGIEGLASIGDFINSDINRIYVFDDLERCVMNPDLVLGYINELVEHDGCKVIIIANEQKLLNNNNYVEKREKLIGRILEVQPATDSAFRYFLDQIESTSAREILSNHSSIISTIFSEASATNFRILQQTMWDFERLIECLEERHFQNAAGIKSLLLLFFAFSLEVKAGTISQEDIINRPSSLIREINRNHNSETELSLDTTQNLFSEVDIYDQLLNNQVLSDLLFKGVVNKDLVRSSIDQSTYYINVAAEPAWRTVWHAYEREESEFNTAFIEMERQFQEREIQEIGVILHIVGIRLWLSTIEVLPLTREDILEQARDYAKDLYSKKTPPISSEIDFTQRHFQGYAGLGLHEVESQDFCDFINFLRELQNQAEIDSYPERAEKLLKEMESDVDLFYRRICWSSSEDNIYPTTPLLAEITPIEFVKRVIALSVKEQRRIIVALYSRYSGGHLNKELAKEKNWLSEVRKEFNLALEPLAPIVKWGIYSALNHYLDPLITDEGNRDIN